MLRRICAAILAAIALSGDFAAGQTADEQTSIDTLKAAGLAYDAGDCASALKLGQPLIDEPSHSGLSGDLLNAAYEMVVDCARREGAMEKAYSYALQGTALDAIGDRMWRFRFAYELDQGRDAAAVATLEDMNNGRGAAMNAVPIRWMGQLNRRLGKPESAALKRRLLEIATTNYAPDEPLSSTDGFVIDYARMLHDSGDTVRAAALTRRIEYPTILIQASLDARLRAYLPPNIDVRAAFEQKLARDQAVAEAHPDLLEAFTAQAEDLRRLGRPNEALAVLDQAQARLGDTNAFSDLQDHINWFWDSRGRTFRMLGRYEDSVASFRQGAALKEGGQPNISQVINLAETQNRLGRGADALETLAVFADAERKSSPFGDMEMRFARACASVIAGRPQAAAADLDYARSHEKDHPEALADMLLCFGDLDGAAAAFIRRLDDPERRTGALEQLSDYDNPPIALPNDPVFGQLSTLKKRADVRAAIARAGGTRRFNVQPGGL